MGPLDPQKCKHTTAKEYYQRDKKGLLIPLVGVDFFDDEEPGMVTIYVRYADGTRWPARTVNMAVPKHAEDVLLAWSAKSYDGSPNDSLHDYRQNRVPDCGGTPCSSTE